MPKIKIVMLCSPQGNQKALAHKIHQAVGLHEIIVCTGGGGVRGKSFVKHTADKIGRALGLILTGFVFRRLWFAMLRHYEANFPDFPIEPALACGDVNDPSVLERVTRLAPDLVVVSGTNLLKAPLIREIHKHGKVINLHTGISPYVKGGPNCTNWCLYLREFALIGNTVMWLDTGIDSGNIIATERTPLSGTENLLALHIKVMDHAHGLYLRAIQKFARGEPLPSVPQTSLQGRGHRLFRTKDWGLVQQWVALTNFLIYYKRDLQAGAVSSPVGLVSLPPP